MERVGAVLHKEKQIARAKDKQTVRMDRNSGLQEPKDVQTVNMDRKRRLQEPKVVQTA